MAETADDLSTPLGQETARRKRRFRLPFTGIQALAVLLGLFLAVFAGFAIFNDNPLGGEPMARIALRAAGHAGRRRTENPPGARRPTPSTAPGRAKTGRAGRAQDRHHHRRLQRQAPGRRDRRRRRRQGRGRRRRAAMMAGIDQRLLEKSRYGMIPVVADGLKPFTRLCRRRADRAKAAKMPVVAIVVAGLGVGAAKTTDAIMKLPAAVTLAFTPYGSDPAKLVERARAQRHEVLLQIPMEPFDYPDNDPGPQTLLTTLGAEQNLDRLHWHLSRFQGYAGIANFMGARFVATDAAMQPIIREAAKRGLGYLDDGSAPRSIAPALAAAQAMPFAKADLAIDAVPTAAEIDRALAQA